MNQDQTSVIIPGSSIGSCSPALRAWLVARRFAAGDAPVLWLVESPDELYAACENLAVFMDERHIAGFEPRDVRPYQDDSPAREISARRIAVLSRLLAGERLLVVAPVEAVLPRTMGVKDLREAKFALSVDEEIDRDELARSLVNLGYTREALIDDVGQFSIRGSIMDIFSPGMEQPVRLDLFGDTIAEMRNVDTATQRSGKAVRRATILPAAEVFISPDHVRRARPLIRRSRNEQAAFLIRDLEQGILPPGIEDWLTCFYDYPATLFAYLPGETVVVGPDAPALTEIHEGARGLYERMHARDASRPAPDELLVSAEELAAEVGRHPHVSTSLGLHDAVPHHPFVPAGPQPPQVVEGLEGLHEQNLDVIVCAGTQMLQERLAYALEQRGHEVRELERDALLRHRGGQGRWYLAPGPISESFVLPGEGLAFISGEQFFGARRRRRLKVAGQAVFDPFTQLNVGDPVVHRDNGIGIFQGVDRLELNGITSDFVTLEYLGGDRLYVPVYRLSLIQRYIGDADHLAVDRLGGTRWARARGKAKESVEVLAAELLQVYARREQSKGHSFTTAGADIEAFTAAFPFEETEDQLKAIEDVYDDLASGRPMDRLICGDVGYGKTEVALRAAFVSAMEGRQVAVLVPTTLLARQHLLTFRERFADWPLRVEGITSFASSTHNRQVLEDVGKGGVDILIGTHGILSEKVKFSNLGLLVVDEEHRFGVRHKERIKQMRAEVEVLTLTATPIPRTLNMAISGIRDMSVIETPPVTRKTIDTGVARFDEEIISQTIERELGRGGQVYFVHNRVASIENMARTVQAICPRARIGVAHGQMPKRDLEKVMGKFMDRSVTVLVCSAIISAGIDIGNANTIIINRADTFGLADLYQLRGRVGRSRTKGHALLLVPAAGQITRDAHKRLSAIKEYESLGAGFQMAMRDMEIRGVGDILGGAQWGHVSAIGYELYQEMLKEEVDRLQGNEPSSSLEPEITLGLDAYIPDDYCPDQHLRLGLYKRLSRVGRDEIGALEAELEDLYGPVPAPVQTLLGIAELRDRLKYLRIEKLEVANNRLRFSLARDTRVNLDALIALVTKKNGRLYPDGKAELRTAGEQILHEVRAVLDELAPADQRL